MHRNFNIKISKTEEIEECMQRSRLPARSDYFNNLLGKLYG